MGRVSLRFFVGSLCVGILFIVGGWVFLIGGPDLSGPGLVAATPAPMAKMTSPRLVDMTGVPLDNVGFDLVPKAQVDSWVSTSSGVVTYTSAGSKTEFVAGRVKEILNDKYQLVLSQGSGDTNVSVPENEGARVWIYQGDRLEVVSPTLDKLMNYGLVGQVVKLGDEMLVVPENLVWTNSSVPGMWFVIYR